MISNPSRIRAYFRLTRPANCLIVAASVFVGGILAGASSWGMVILASISALLIAGGGYSINDYFDYDADRVNRPTRPIPSGRVERKKAVHLSLLLFVLGLLLSARIGHLASATAVAVCLLLFFYSFAFKRQGLTGNLVVSLSTGLAFFYGAVAGGRAVRGIIPFGFAFLFHLGREVLKDIEDVQGDEAAGAKTIPLTWGKRPALNFSFGVFLFLIALTPLPYLLHIYGLLYLIVALIGVDVALLAMLLWLKRGALEGKVGTANHLLKVDMLVGLLALYLGRF